METTQKALEYLGVFDYMDHLKSAEYLWKLLAELPTPDVVQDSIQKKDYKLIIKPQLEATIPQISWSILFSTLLNVELDDSSYVQVYFLDEISNFFNKLQAKDNRTVQNSLLAVFAHDLYADLMLSHSPCDREQYCLHVAASLMPAVVSNLYLGTFPADTDRDLRTQVTSLYSELKATMKEKLVEADWLDNKTRNQVEMKLNFMSIQLPKMFDESFLNTSLEQLITITTANSGVATEERVERPLQGGGGGDRGAAGGRTIKLREAAPSTRITAAQCLCVSQSVIDLG
ncbi:hypothetical protein J6590_069777 [Homalodisca vitripennis]|nr:hypothetical protein J6590_069777 [Homalodisca vitripennis]